MTKQELLKLIMKEIDNIPPIPENINKIKKLIKSTTSSVQSIANYVKRDPALTADLLKIANSAAYMTRNRVNTAERAITTIGLVQLETIILTIGARQVLEGRYEAAESIWEHSFKCGFYAKHLLTMKRLNDDADSVYTAGLLHDIGKLVLLSLRPELVDKINKLSLAKNVPIHQIEKLAIGLSHAEIGEKIAASWNFPTNLVKAIGDHHQPRLSNEEHRPMVYTTYLANILCKRPEAESVFSTIEEKVLEFFEIDSVKTLESIIHTLDEFYLTASEALNV